MEQYFVYGSRFQQPFYSWYPGKSGYDTELIPEETYERAVDTIALILLLRIKENLGYDHQHDMRSILSGETPTALYNFITGTRGLREGAKELEGFKFVEECNYSIRYSDVGYSGLKPCDKGVEYTLGISKQTISADADGNINVCPLAVVPVSINTIVDAMKKLSDMH